jgi:hypothetical protein
MDEPLSKSEERFIETSPLALGLFRVAGPQVDLLACSPSFASYVQGLVGTKREDFLSLLREDCSAVDFEVIKRDYDVGRLSLNGAFQTLFRLKDNTGHFAPFSAQGKLVNESGGTQRLYLFLFPVDGAVLRSVEQKEEEERQSQLFDEILSTTKTAIFWKDAQRRFLGANTAFLDYYGFATEAAILAKTMRIWAGTATLIPIKTTNFAFSRKAFRLSECLGNVWPKAKNATSLPARAL